MKINSLMTLITLSAALFLNTALAESYEKLITKADQLYSQRADLDKARLAESTLQTAIKKDGNGAHAYWRLSRIQYFISYRLPEDEREEYLEQAVEDSKKAVELGPNMAETHYWQAQINLAFGEAAGVMKAVYLVKPTKKELQEVIRINKNYAGGGAYRSLGIINLEVPMFLGGNKDKALEQLEQAYQIDAKNLITRAYLAKAWAEFDRVNDAVKMLKEVISGPCHKDYQAECELEKSYAKKILSDI